jgi:hypothetical protein
MQSKSKVTSMEKQTFEIWLSVNEDGDAAVSLEGVTESREALVEDYGGGAIRTIKLSTHMTLPQVIETEVDVPDEAGTTEQIEAEAA